MKIFIESLKCILFIGILITSCHSYCQGTIEGIVKSKENIPIPYISVYLKENPTKGTTTNEDGFFSFTFELVQKDILVVFSGMGYKKEEVLINSDSPNVLEIVLKSETNLLDEVVLSAESNSSKEYTVSTMNKIDIYTNPTAGADPLRAILNKPFSTTIDETANPSFRGSNPDKSRVFLNGVPILNPVRNNQINGLGNFSLFNTEIIERQLIYPSNPPLTYGNSSAGIVEIETSEKTQNSTQFSASVASVGLLINKNLSDKSFVQLYSNKQFDDIFKPINGSSFEFLKNFSSFDFGLNYRYNFNNKSSLNVFGYFINESSTVETSIANTRALNYSENTRFFTVLNYSKVWDILRFSFNSGYDYSKAPSRFSNINVNTRNENLYSSINFSLMHSGFFIKTGLSYNLIKNRYKGQYPRFNFGFSLGSPVDNINNDLENQIGEGFLYLKKTISNVILSGALRKNIPITNFDNEGSKADYLSYQSSVRWDISNKDNIIFSLGKYHNFSSPSLILPRTALNTSFQYALDYTYEIKSLKLQAAAYYKAEEGLVSNSFDVINNTISNREILGFEVMAEGYLIKNINFQLAYTYLDSKIILDETKFRGANDLDFFIKSSLSYYNNGFGMAINYSLRPGNYYTKITSSSFNDNIMDFVPVFSEQFNTEKFENYSRVDMNINKRIQFKEGGDILLFGTINNVLNADNQRNIIFNEDYSFGGYEVYQKRFFFLGFVISL